MGGPTVPTNHATVPMYMKAAAGSSVNRDVAGVCCRFAAGLLQVCCRFAAELVVVMHLCIAIYSWNWCFIADLTPPNNGGLGAGVECAVGSGARDPAWSE